jgi:hypothetical protein
MAFAGYWSDWANGRDFSVSLEPYAVFLTPDDRATVLAALPA